MRRKNMSIHARARIYNLQYLLVWHHITLGRMGSAPSSPSLSLESTGSTPSLVSPSRDSLSTINRRLLRCPCFPGGHGAGSLWLSVSWSWLRPLRRVELVAPHDEFNSSSSVYNPTYEYSYIHILPGIHIRSVIILPRTFRSLRSVRHSIISMPVRPASPRARSTTPLHLILSIHFILSTRSLQEHFVPFRNSFCILMTFFPTYPFHFVNT